MDFQAPKVIFKNGHFYDLISEKRIILKDSARVVLVGNSSEFFQTDPNNQPHARILTPVEQENEVNRLSKGRKYHKLLHRGDVLYFDIRVNVKGHDEKRRIETVFELLLQEDLYVYDKRQPGPVVRDGIADCACEVIRNPKGNVAYFETIYANSLNSAYWKTYVHYFGVNGASTCNAFTKFYYRGGNGKVKIKDLKPIAQTLLFT